MHPFILNCIKRANRVFRVSVVSILFTFFFFYFAVFISWNDKKKQSKLHFIFLSERSPLKCTLHTRVRVLLLLLFDFILFFLLNFETDRFRRSNDDVLSRAKRKTLRMTITIVIVFIVSWTPFYVMSVWYVT